MRASTAWICLSSSSIVAGRLRDGWLAGYAVLSWEQFLL
jgi:hypothetical protein